MSRQGTSYSLIFVLKEKLDNQSFQTSRIDPSNYYYLNYFEKKEQLYGIVVNPLQMVLEFVGGGNLYRLLHSQVSLSFQP